MIPWCALWYAMRTLWTFVTPWSTPSSALVARWASTYSWNLLLRSRESYPAGFERRLPDSVPSRKGKLALCLSLERHVQCQQAKDLNWFWEKRQGHQILHQQNLKLERKPRKDRGDNSKGILCSRSYAEDPLWSHHDRTIKAWRHEGQS